MIREEGRVIEVREGRALVQTTRSTSCSSCGARSACAGLSGGREARLWAMDVVGVERGDIVTIGIRENMVLKGAFLVYLLPVIALIAGAWIGDRLGHTFGFPPDLVALGLGLTCLIAGFIPARFFGRRLKVGPRVIDKKVPDEFEEE